MRTWKFLVAGLLLAAAAGCQTDPNILMLERELRAQEDEIYRLRAQLEDYHDVMQSGAVPAVVVDQSPSAPGSAPPRARRSVPPDTRGSNSTDLPSLQFEMPEKSSTAPPDTLKHQTAPNRSDPSPDAPRSGRTNQPRKNRLAAGPKASRTKAIRRAGATGSRRVAGLALNRQLCGGYDDDGRPGDEGIALRLQPRDAQGRLVEAPGKVAVVVLDPALQGESARVARWDFSAAQTSTRFRGSGTARGIHLNAAWPAAAPSHGELHVFVRYTTVDGRRFEMDQPIHVALPGERVPRWVATDPLIEPPSPTVRLPQPQPVRTASRPAEPSVRRPEWSPDRRP